MRFVVAVLVLVVGCVDPSHVLCSGSVVCPSEFTCKSFGCASDGDIAACAELADGMTCTTERGGGVCTDRACQVAICGNSIIEPGEVCDDGDVVSGDGCSGTCLSAEICGNGIAELEEECDCGSPEQPGAESCNVEQNMNAVRTYNGGELCTDTCVRRRCGNGVVDPTEVCDDGNDVVGDGCSGECQSDETCGNNFVDFGKGEQCDDGNTRGRDACSSQCLAEFQTWQRTRFGFPARRKHALVYDSGRGRIVLFGGSERATSFDDTWELDGTDWAQVFTTRAPHGREGHAMAYDAKRARIVMFGGRANGNLMFDTWEFDGVTWTQVPGQLVPGVIKPSARVDHAMVYDPVRERIVLFGGADAVSRRNDTWEFDGKDWKLLAVSSPPSARSAHAMAYDAKRGAIVVFGGATGAVVNFDPAYPDTRENDTWELASTATEWTQRAIAASDRPSARDTHAMAYDASRQRVVIYGGRPSNTLGQHLDDAYELVGSAWVALPSAGQARFDHAMAYDVRRERVVTCGGWDGIPTNNPAAFGDTRELDSGGWTALVAELPPARVQHGLAYDASRGVTVMFGGYSSSAARLDDTWELGPIGWRQASPPSLPEPRLGHAMVYDGERRRVVMLGGSADGSMLDDVLEYDGSTWTDRTPAGTKPSARWGHAAAYDIARRRVVVFGGLAVFNPGQPALADTWTLDTSTTPWTWIPMTPADSPSARWGHAMAYDAKRGVVVLYGGENESTFISNETWEWNGTNWTRRTPSEFPVARSGHAMTYDHGRGRVVVYGGGGLSGGRFDDLWEYEGTTWIRYSAFGGLPIPDGRRLVASTYDALRQRVVVFGGDTSTTRTDETWSFAYTSVSPVEACASTVDVDRDGVIGCADDDCWGVCSPLCSPVDVVASCPMTPRCGDGACTTVESCRSCPQDCAVSQAGGCPLVCGDLHCDPAETISSCPGDCTP